MEVIEIGPKHTSEKHESDIYSINDSKNGFVILIDTINEQGIPQNLKIFFKCVQAFRYLDEGDLIYYWESKAFYKPYHVFKILSGGWSNGEKINSGILSISIANEVAEWFIVTTNGCINVLSTYEPTIEYINA